MSIQINKDICIGCSRCQQVCPGTLIYKDEVKKAYIAYPSDCWGCVSCVKECPVGAISFFLGEDMGGKGATMVVRTEGHLLHWDITKIDGTVQRITVNAKESNAY